MSGLLDDRDGWSMANCSINRALDVVGTRSAMLVMREALLGTRRFDEFARHIGIGEPALAARLRELTEHGLLERTPYREPGSRTRHEYRLTRKGAELLPIITALRQWGDDWAAAPEGPPLRTTHRGCGAPVRAQLRCTEGHEVGHEDVAIEAGPGLITRR